MLGEEARAVCDWDLPVEGSGRVVPCYSRDTTSHASIFNESVVTEYGGRGWTESRVSILVLVVPQDPAVCRVGDPEIPGLVERNVVGVA